MTAYDPAERYPAGDSVNQHRGDGSLPTDYSGFALKPVGLFDRNPALGVPKAASSHCAAAEGHCQ